MQKIKMLARAIAQFVLAPPPVNRKVIALFNAFNGQYACNPKYILLKLHEKASSLMPYLVVSEKHSGEDALPEFVRAGIACKYLARFSGNYCSNLLKNCSYRRASDIRA